MYVRTSELRDLDVINVQDGRIMGNVCDVDLDPDSGALRALILDRPRGIMGFLRREDLEVPWTDVVLVGVDVILIRLAPQDTSRHRAWRR